MAYRLKLDKSAKNGIRKVAQKQLENAIRGLEGAAEERLKQVHDIRVRLKKVRAALRLARSAIGGQYQTENACFRETAHELSPLRDAQAALEMFGKLTAGKRREDAAALSSAALEAFSRRLAEEQQSAAAQATDEVWSRLAGTLREALDRLDAWTDDIDGFETIAAGLKDSYRRGRRAMRCALERPAPETLHEWRKQAKYHRYQINLLENAWPEAMKSRAKSLKRLSDLLGEDHDLVVLREKFQAAAGEIADESAVARCLELVDRRRGEVFAELKPSGRLIYAEKAKQLRDRLTTYWRIACSETNSHGAG